VHKSWWLIYSQFICVVHFKGKTLHIMIYLVIY